MQTKHKQIKPRNMNPSSAKKSASPPSDTSVQSVASAKVESEQPPPDILLQEAMKEPDRRTLSAYGDTIRVLRDKGFTFREIAAWLDGNGIEADHNAVYRVYTRGMSDQEVAELAHSVEDEEQGP